MNTTSAGTVLPNNVHTQHILRVDFPDGEKLLVYNKSEAADAICARYPYLSHETTFNRISYGFRRGGRVAELPCGVAVTKVRPSPRRFNPRNSKRRKRYTLAKLKVTRVEWRR